MTPVTKILVADDDAHGRDLMRTMLERARYIVVDAADGTRRSARWRAITRT